MSLHNYYVQGTMTVQCMYSNEYYMYLAMVIIIPCIGLGLIAEGKHAEFSCIIIPMHRT